MSTTDARELLNRGLAKTLGIEILEATKEKVVGEMMVTQELHQPFGYLHGGASVALAETVASIGGYLNCPPGMAAMGLEINANHLRSKQTGILTATGVPLHLGKTTQVWEIKIKDEADKLVCISRCTVAVVPVKE